MDMGLSELRELVMDREAWRAVVHVVTTSLTWLSGWTELAWNVPLVSLIFFFKFIYFNWRLITLQYCSVFCHTLTWISHECTCVPHPESPSHLPPRPISQGHPNTPALSALSHASNVDWRSISHILIYIYIYIYIYIVQCYSLKSSHPRLLPQSLKVSSLHLCLFCCLAYRGIIIIFLNSIY